MTKTSSSASTAGVVINRAEAIARLGGDEAAYQRVAEHAAVFMQHWSDDFQRAQRERQREPMYRLAHDLKSVARTVGATALGDRSAALEAALRDQSEGSDHSSDDDAHGAALAALLLTLAPTITALTQPR